MKSEIDLNRLFALVRAEAWRRVLDVTPAEWLKKFESTKLLRKLRVTS